jgi:hypothetical protein
LTSRAQAPTTDIRTLQQNVKGLQDKFLVQQQQLVRTALQKGWPLVIPSKKGHNLYLTGVDHFGKPVYVATVDNIISAATIRTNQLWPGGAAKLSLNGSADNVKGKIAIWDEGLVRPTHVELTGRVIQVDNATALSDHSTHVSGTMIAAGVNPVAKGMAFGEQLLQCYDFYNDANEMSAAAKQGLLLSNHSYATVAGWNPDATNPNQWDWFGNPGDTVDINFGLYDTETQQWDSIAYLNPLYLICKAGGNNRGDTGPPAGTNYYRYNSQGSLVNAGPRPAFGTATSISSNAGYMTLATYGNAKNTLTLGAVQPIPGGYNKPSDVVLAEFSSIGPTGDGRIKPDLVADGVNVLSCISTSDNSYDIYSGTSMATPAATGSSLLLQQYYSQLHSVFMRSSTLKALLIHTADEAGPYPGPDYVFGWGLIDIAKAAAVITSDNTDQVQQIHESSLTNGTKDSESWNITASGKTPVSATICWIDPPGVPINIPATEHNLKDNGLKLINDLDLRIKDNTTGAVYMPWTLNPASPGAAANKSDNFRDNVEKVELTDSLIPGRSYTVTITHKGTLKDGGTQAYSLILSGAGGLASCVSASTASGASIDKITLSNLTNNPPANTCRSYTDYSSLTPANLPVGQTVPISINSTSCNGSNNTRIISVYIDFNNDGTFESNELAYQSAASPGGSFSGSIAVPTTAVVGTYARMRVIAEETSNPAAVSPCGTYGAGETQDYRVAFTNPSTDVGIADLEYPGTSVCPNDSTIIAVRIHNYGNIIQDAVPVTTVVTQNGNVIATYSTTCRDSIPADSDVVFTYSGASLNLTPGASYTFTSHTSLSGDFNTANDSNVTTVTANPAGASTTGSATICGNNATSVQLKANSSGDNVVLWYNSQTASMPIAAGNNTSTTDIEKTYYVALNDLKAKGGSPSALALAPASGSPGFYYPFDGQFVEFTTSVPLTIQSARLYAAYPGTVVFTLASLASFTTQGYSYYPIDSVSINVYATNPTPTPGRVSVNAGQMNDTGAIYYLNLPIPNPGTYILIAQCYGSNLFLNSNITANPYPITIPGVFSITGNSNKYNPNNSSDTTYDRGYYFPMYDIGLTLDECPGPRTAVTATTEAAPQITLVGSNVLTSSADSGNQWYLNDTLIGGATGQTDTVHLPGMYYTMVTDPVTGCVLKSNIYNYTSQGNGIGLTVAPNPSNGAFLLEFAFTTSDNTAVQIYDMIGQRVYDQELGSFTGIFSQQIDAVGLSAGIYVVKIIHGGSTYEQKILIKH